MKKWIALEEAALTIAALAVLIRQAPGLPAWALLLLFFAPDLSMIGYVFNAKAGALCYNVAHHRGIALLIAASGFYGHIGWLLTAGILLFAHASFDRILGYGLKYATGFGHTHLGAVGKRAATSAAARGSGSGLPA